MKKLSKSIDNCLTPEQRINAKLAIINSWLIKSPLIVKFLPEFLSFIQRRELFKSEDFNPKYIRHLSSLATKHLIDPTLSKYSLNKLYKHDKKYSSIYEFVLFSFQLLTLKT